MHSSSYSPHAGMVAGILISGRAQAADVEGVGASDLHQTERTRALRVLLRRSWYGFDAYPSFFLDCETAVLVASDAAVVAECVTSYRAGGKAESH